MMKSVIPYKGKEHLIALNIDPSSTLLLFLQIAGRQRSNGPEHCRCRDRRTFETIVVPKVSKCKKIFF